MGEDEKCDQIGWTNCYPSGGLIEAGRWETGGILHLGTPGQGGHCGQTVGHAITLGPQHGTGLLKKTQWPQRGLRQRERAMLHCQRKQEGCRAGMLEMGQGPPGDPHRRPGAATRGGRKAERGAEGGRAGGIAERPPAVRSKGPAAAAASGGPGRGERAGGGRPRPRRRRQPRGTPAPAAARARSAEPGRPLRVPRLGGVKREPQPGGGRRGSGACYTASGL